jgi:hypothetical protein
VAVPGSVDGGRKVMEQRQLVLSRQVWVKRTRSTTTKNKNDGSIRRLVNHFFINTQNLRVCRQDQKRF